ncbi:MAG: rod shape-determining protein RodA [Epsilonproteobacteria bacterium]|nr:rod shape-determining protein RodA [Campylobacterota bacterium]
MINNKAIYHFDFVLLFLLFPFIGISLFLVHEISPILFKKEIAYITIGFVAFLVAFLFPIRKYLWIIPFLYFVNIALLVGVDLFGVSILGAQRWLKIPIINLTIQPSEFMKTTMILMLGYKIYKNPPDKGYTFVELIKISWIILLPFVLIAKEPDLGTALVLLIVGFGTLIIVGVKRKVLINGIVFLLVFIPFAYQFLLKDYQRNRINNFLGHPSYHVKQSMIAVGSGGVFGKDKQKATQTQLKFLPIASSDFIFAYYAERFGFVGVIVLLSLYFFLSYYLLSYVSILKNDFFAMPIFASVGLIVFVYSYVNIAMTINLAPVVGIPLPLLSHGGTSFINFMIIFGILENLLAFKYEFLYNFNQENEDEGL